MIERLKALPKPVKVIAGVLIAAAILSILAGCVQPPMRVDFMGGHTG